MKALKRMDKGPGSGLAFPKLGKKTTDAFLKKLDKPDWKKYRTKLDLIFAKFIRGRDGAFEVGACISCGKISRLQCGHFIKRQYMGTRWDEINCAGQCVHCNYALQGNDIEFEKGLIRRYGKEAVDYLQIKKKLGARRPEIFWLQHQIFRYETKCKEMKNER